MQVQAFQKKNTEINNNKYASFFFVCFLRPMKLKGPILICSSVAHI